jgi:hypothetical protein
VAAYLQILRGTSGSGGIWGNMLACPSSSPRNRRARLVIDITNEWACAHEENEITLPSAKRIRKHNQKFQTKRTMGA